MCGRGRVEVSGLDGVPYSLDHPLRAGYTCGFDEQAVLFHGDFLGFRQYGELNSQLLSGSQIAGQLGVQQQLLGRVFDLVTAPSRP